MILKNVLSSVLEIVTLNEEYVISAASTFLLVMNFSQFTNFLYIHKHYPEEYQEHMLH